MTAEQMRAGRALIRWSQKDLAEASGVSEPTVRRLEQMTGALAANSRTVEALQKALEGAGVQFIPENGAGPGVRLASRLS